VRGWPLFLLIVAASGVVTFALAWWAFPVIGAGVYALAAGIGLLGAWAGSVALRRERDGG